MGSAFCFPGNFPEPEPPGQGKTKPPRAGKGKNGPVGPVGMRN